MATTKAKALLVEMARSLATEATTAGKTDLATALNDFATEVTSDSVTDDTFFQSFDSAGTATSGKGNTWANILQGAAAVVHSKAQNTIADKSGTIATNTTAIAAADTTIAAQTTIVAAQTTVVADKQTAIETYQKRLKELGEGVGIRIISPGELIGLAKLYQTQIEQGKILDQGDTVSAEQQANARAKFKDLTRKLEALLSELRSS